MFIFVPTADEFLAEKRNFHASVVEVATFPTFATFIITNISYLTKLTSWLTSSSPDLDAALVTAAGLVADHQLSALFKATTVAAEGRCAAAVSAAAVAMASAKGLRHQLVAVNAACTGADGATIQRLAESVLDTWHKAKLLPAPRSHFDQCVEAQFGLAADRRAHTNNYKWKVEELIKVGKFVMCAPCPIDAITLLSLNTMSSKTIGT